MMNLTTDPYSSTTISNTEPGVKFETLKLMEGTKAMDIASKYFPSMVKRLEIHDVTNESYGIKVGMGAGGSGGGNNSNVNLRSSGNKNGAAQQGGGCC